MVVNDEKPKGQRARKPKPPPSFEQRVRKIEREINILAKLVRDFKKAYISPKPKSSQKKLGKPTDQGDKTSKST